MNHWPPPSVEDAPSAPPAAVTSTRWWQRPIARAVLAAWLVGGMVALVAIGFVRVVDMDAARPTLTPASSTMATTTTLQPLTTVTIDPTTSNGSTTASTTTTTTTTMTTAPLVQSAPPVPPASGSGAPPATVVVTLPPRTTSPATIDWDRRLIGVEINFDAEGDDATDPNGEWVRFVNLGDQPVDMGGWLVRDDGFENAHVFEPLTLEPGASVTVYSGCGSGTADERFFCVGEVWDNDGDVVSLLDHTGVLIVQRHG